MSTQTPNLGLDKPAGNERALVSVINGNMDKLDAAVGAVDAEQDGSLQEQVNALVGSVSRFNEKVAFYTVASQKTIHFERDGCVLIGKRDTDYFIALVDSFTQGVSLIGSAPNISFTHSAQSNDVTVTNNRSGGLIWLLVIK